MQYSEMIEKENEEVRERYNLAVSRMKEMIQEESRVKQPFQDYFVKVAKFLMTVVETVACAETGDLRKLSLEELEQMNYRLYEDVLEENYESSYANPVYAIKQLGEECGQYLSFLYTELRGTIAYAHEYSLFEITIVFELFIEIYNIFEREEEDELDLGKAVKSAIYYYMTDYSEDRMEKNLRERLDADGSFAAEIIMESNLDTPEYLYYFGEYISENERKMVEFLNSLPQETIESLARTYTEGFKKGFEIYRIDLSKKSVVNIRYYLGFERIVREAVRQFEAMGLKATFQRAAVSSICKNKHLKIGYCSIGANRQYDYDHRMDAALYTNKKFLERKLTALRLAYEKHEKLAAQFAGPAVIEIFGEPDFEPEDKKEAPHYSDKQQKMLVDYQREAAILGNEYIKSDEYSFTIIAYPVPSIGENFEEIFKETVKVNTLDVEQYQEIQQHIIDALDKGTYVQIKGMGDNRTDLTVALHEIDNPEEETGFENCLADVNIPLGEVFTSPKLTGTNGLLHVTGVYLNGLLYKNLALEFKDGMISSYECSNFDTEESNQAFIRDNLLHQHDTLPMGEFAIGTNTTAYVMGQKYNISDKLPILIAEKTGPHFAVGDTCFKMAEDMETFNPDGKKMIAKDNECTIQRKTSMEKAYFNCHTDITIPYNELGEITVYTKEEKAIPIIKDGRFVLEGTEALNKPLE